MNKIIFLDIDGVLNSQNTFIENHEYRKFFVKNINKSIDDEMIINGQGRFFYNVDSFESIIPYIKEIKRFDLSKLDGIVEEFDELLHKYQCITRMTDRRINKICTLLSSRINKLKDIQKNREKV